MEGQQEDNMQARQEGEVEQLPSRKKLKSSDCDLTIKLKFNSSSSSEGEQGEDPAAAGTSTEKSYEVHSVVMASHSGYFDSLLDSGLSEAQSKMVTLENVEPEVFELALELLEDPVKASSVTIEQIIQVAPFYNRFLFAKGLELAKSVMLSYMNEQSKVNQTAQDFKTKTISTRDLDRIIDVILIADEIADLEEIKELGIKYLRDQFGYVLPTRLATFTLEHWQRLHRFIVANFEATMGLFILDWSHALEDEDFPSILYKSIIMLSNVQTIRKAGARIQVSVEVKRHGDASSSSDLSFEQILQHDRLLSEEAFSTVEVEGLYPRIYCYQTLRPDDGSELLDWAIDVHLEEGVLHTFDAPNSSHHFLPPAHDSWGKTIGDSEFIVKVNHLF